MDGWIERETERERETHTETETDRERERERETDRERQIECVWGVLRESVLSECLDDDDDDSYFIDGWVLKTRRMDMGLQFKENLSQ